MLLTPLLMHDTRAGPFFIAVDGYGRFHAVFGEESLGSYKSIVCAIEDLVGGHTFWPTATGDPSALGISSDPADWTVLAGSNAGSN